MVAPALHLFKCGHQLKVFDRCNGNSTAKVEAPTLQLLVPSGSLHEPQKWKIEYQIEPIVFFNKLDPGSKKQSFIFLRNITEALYLAQFPILLYFISIFYSYILVLYLLYRYTFFLGGFICFA